MAKKSNVPESQDGLKSQINAKYLKVPVSKLPIVRAAISQRDLISRPVPDLLNLDA